MIGAHIVQVIKPELVDKYLDWRHRESQLSASAPGFIKRQLLRDAEQPNVFYYITFWETKEHIDAFTSTPEFHRIVEASGIAEVMAASTTTRQWVTEEFEQRPH